MKARTPDEQLVIGMANAVEVGDCLEWQGSFSNKGTQPSVKFRNPEKTYVDNVCVPRMLWEREHGPIPAGLWVYRKCCNTACVCLEHLAVGTRKDLMRARRKAGTTKHKPTTKLAMTLAARRRPTVVNTAEQADLVREMLCAGIKRVEISERAGVSVDMVADIARGKSWRQLGSPWAGLGAA